MNNPICPMCGNSAKATDTIYGVRHSCCGLWSWEGKPLVSAEVHKERQRCHNAVDMLWLQNPNGKKIRKYVYQWLSSVTGLPEPECHMSVQTDLEKLRLIHKMAYEATPAVVMDWIKRRRRGVK